ncbi:hypothetical protein CH365_07950 [Leptospira neocaledonica]|uniref:Uncharacterized protein n=1 Tax=Leptospira neocaledonica TaxID=2023192 RepID=A0A2M9ZZS8_9LEPT|nr:hypothetical protein CH365_07950 [Leptospira neocaledonica]
MRLEPWMAKSASKTPWSQVEHEARLRNGESFPAQKFLSFPLKQNLNIPKNPEGFEACERKHS